jgi:hypothetical protein
MNKYSKFLTLVMLFLSLALIKAQEPVVEKTEASLENNEKENTLRFLTVHSDLWGECDNAPPILVDCVDMDCLSCVGGTCFPDCDYKITMDNCPQYRQYCF